MVILDVQKPRPPPPHTTYCGGCGRGRPPQFIVVIVVIVVVVVMSIASRGSLHIEFDPTIAVDRACFCRWSVPIRMLLTTRHYSCPQMITDQVKHWQDGRHYDLIALIV